MATNLSINEKPVVIIKMAKGDDVIYVDPDNVDEKAQSGYSVISQKSHVPYGGMIDSNGKLIPLHKLHLPK